MQAADHGESGARGGEPTPWRWSAWSATLAATLFGGLVLEVFRTWGPALQTGLAANLRPLPATWADIISSGALQGLIFGMFLVAAVVATRLDGRRLWAERVGVPTRLTTGLALGAGGLCAATAIAALAGAVIAEPALSGPGEPLAILVGLGLVAFQSVSEEAFFRGWLQPILCFRWTPRVGLVVTSLLFASLHVISNLFGGSPVQGALAMANIFLGGMVFGLLALRTAGLVAPAAAHFAWNWTESGALGLDPQPTGSLFHLGLTGHRLWNGGSDTMNGSLATTLVLVALTCALAVWRSGRSAAGLAMDAAP